MWPADPGPEHRDLEAGMDTDARTDVWRRHGRATTSTRRHVDLVRVGSALCR